MRVEIEIGWEQIETVLAERDSCLVGKLSAECRVNKGVIKATLTKIWRLNGSFTIHEIPMNLFVISFATLRYKEQVIARKPWFDNHLLVL